LVDLPAEALRARIAAGAVYSAEQAGGALADYFRAANLQALSELGRAWMAGTVEAVGDELLVRLGLAEPSAQAVLVAGGSRVERGGAGDPARGRAGPGRRCGAAGGARPDRRRPHPPGTPGAGPAPGADRRTRRHLHRGHGGHPGGGAR